jgi:hypothetical protein
MSAINPSASAPQVATHLYTVASLFNRTLPQEKNAFGEAIEGVFAYVKNKNAGRCKSKRIFDKGERQKLILDLFENYRRGASTKAICETGFMRRIVKHNHDNDSNFQFITEKITPKLIRLMHDGEKLLLQPEVITWLNHLNATTMDPETVAKQKQAMSALPQDYQDRLSEGRVKLGKDLMVCINSKWLDKEILGEIIKGIEAEALDLTVEPKLTKETIVSYFVFHYRSLILQGAEYAKSFKESILIGLNAFLKGPCLARPSNQ